MFILDRKKLFNIATINWNAAQADTLTKWVISSSLLCCCEWNLEERSQREIGITLLALAFLAVYMCQQSGCPAYMTSACMVHNGVTGLYLSMFQSHLPRLGGQNS